MERTTWWAACLILAGLHLPSPVVAQTLLRRLENRLNELLPPVDAAAPADSPDRAGRAAELRREASSASPRRANGLPAVIRGAAPFETGSLGMTAEQDGERLRVAQVSADGPAATAGVRVGDQLLAVNGREVRTTGELAAAIEPFPAGARLTLELVRDGRRERATPILDRAVGEGRDPDRAAERPAERSAPPAVDGEVRAAAAFLVERPTLGARVGPVTDAARRDYGLTTRRGALIAEVAPDGPLARAGVSVGAVVVAIDGRRVDGPQDLIGAVRQARIGQEVELTYYDREQLRRKRVRVASTDDLGDAAGGAPDFTPAPAPRLAPAPTPRTPAVDPPPPPADRPPPLKRLERVLEGLNLPAPSGASPTPPADELRSEVDRLRGEVAALRSRLEELERLLAAGAAPPAEPPLEPQAEAIKTPPTVPVRRPIEDLERRLGPPLEKRTVERPQEKPVADERPGEKRTPEKPAPSPPAPPAAEPKLEAPANSPPGADQPSEEKPSEAKPGEETADADGGAAESSDAG